jgi:hypothetical protein
MHYWKPGDIFEVDCPGCGNPVEFFKDEATRKCRRCGYVVINPRMDFGCAAYCKYAAECLGEIGPDLLKERVALEVKKVLGSDFQRLAHGIKVARLAEEIARREKADTAILLCAAYLHVFEEAAGDPDEKGRQKPREILEGLGARSDLIGQVIEVLDAFRNGEPGDSLNGRVFFEAHRDATE